MAAKGNIVEDKLNALWELQLNDSQIDKLKTLRGELPMEVEDLEDDVLGLETRLDKMLSGVKDVEEKIRDFKNGIKESKALIKKYNDQQEKVRNNREFDSLNKEIEYQNLEIQLAEKKIREAELQIENKTVTIEDTKAMLEDRKKDLELKQAELDGIVKETKKEMDKLESGSKKAEAKIEDRLLMAYKRIRGGAINGLAVVNVTRDACGGCFSKIPPQRQLDIKTYKKIIVCEYCGRILVNKEEPVVEA